MADSVSAAPPVRAFPGALAGDCLSGIAHAVNVGGSGFMLGSLANITALRMAPERRTWIGFHVYSLPFLLVSGARGWLLLR